MRTKRFKTLGRWLDHLSKYRDHSGDRVYEPMEYFFAESLHVYYYTEFGTPNERYHSENVFLPWEQKLPIAERIVKFHWPRKTKSERAWLVEQIARGNGDLHLLTDFTVCIRKENGRWKFNYCTCGLSGPNYDWCKRKYLQSL